MQKFEHQNEEESEQKQLQQVSKQIKKEKSKKQTKKQEDDLDCSICFNKIKVKGVIKNCGHIYCFECIKQWAKSKLTCPQCRSDFTHITKKWKTKNGMKQKTVQVKTESSQDNSSDSANNGDHLIALDDLFEQTALQLTIEIFFNNHLGQRFFVWNEQQ